MAGRVIFPSTCECKNGWERRDGGDLDTVSAPLLCEWTQKKFEVVRQADLCCYQGYLRQEYV